MSNDIRMLLFVAVNSLLNLAANLTHPVTPTIFTNLELGSYMFGYALAAMLLVSFAVSPFWGKINNYISSRTSLFICSIGYGIGQILFALSTLEWHFIAVRMLTGVFTGGVFVSVLTYIINVSDEEQRGYNLTLNATIHGVFSAFGYLAGGLIGSYSPYLSVYIQASLLILCGILFLLVCKNDTAKNKPKLQLKILVKEANPLASFIAGKQFLTPMLIAMFIMCALQYMCYIAFDQSFNYYMRDQFGFPSSYNGVLKGIMGLITLVANSTICIWILKKTNMRKSNIIVFLLCSLSVTLAIVFTDILPFVLFNVVLFALNAVSMPILQNILASDAKGYDSNLLMGFYNALKSFGGIIGAFASGALYSINPLFPFVLVAIGFSIAMLTSIYYYKKQRQSHNYTAML